MLPPHSSPPGTHHVITVTLMTVEVLRHRRTGPLQVKITGATMTAAHIIIKHGGNEKRDLILPEQF